MRDTDRMLQSTQIEDGYNDIYKCGRRGNLLQSGPDF